MCRVIAIANQKGGVGKSTTTSNLGIGLVNEGKKVLLIDSDAQGSLTASLGYKEPDALEITLATVMANIINDVEMTSDFGILQHEEGIDILPGNIELSGLEVSLVNVMSRERVMQQYIEKVRDRYDYILIDCMPSLGMITINAFACADSILIPVQAAYLPVGEFEKYATKMVISNVYMDVKFNKPEYSRTHTAFDRKKIYAAILSYTKKLNPDYEGKVCLETVKCFFTLPPVEREKCKMTYHGEDAVGMILTRKHILALFTHCLVARASDAGEKHTNSDLLSDGTLWEV